MSPDVRGSQQRCDSVLRSFFTEQNRAKKEQVPLSWYPSPPLHSTRPSSPKIYPVLLYKRCCLPALCRGLRGLVGELSVPFTLLVSHQTRLPSSPPCLQTSLLQDNIQSVAPCTGLLLRVERVHRAPMQGRVGSVGGGGPPCACHRTRTGLRRAAVLSPLPCTTKVNSRLLSVLTTPNVLSLLRCGLPCGCGVVAR